MIDIKNLKDLTNEELQNHFNRFGSDFTKIMTETVAPIVNDVKDNGDAAVIKYTEKFDGIKLDSIIASEDEIEEGYKNTAPELIDAIKKAISNIEEFHNHQKQKNIDYTRDNFGRFGVIYQPIDSAAIYVPGGKAAYASTVMMGLVPAKIAGVKNITLITPPSKDGKLNPTVCAVSHLLGNHNIIKSGGAQGIAAAGFGTETVTKSQLIIGPGNIFVTAAKSYLFSLGIIQIDSLAGPSEALIIADDSANPKWTAWDLLSQAEHEENAESILLCASKEFAQKVKDHIIEDLESGRGRSEIKKASVKKHMAFYLYENIDQAIEFSNNYGPEHLEVLMDNADQHLEKFRNVGSLFLGHYSPVAAGDYFSGTNHILPTGGAARFSSGLSVETFSRRITYQNLTREGLLESKEPVKIISEAEGFGDKHGGSVSIRFESDK